MNVIKMAPEVFQVPGYQSATDVSDKYIDELCDALDTTLKVNLKPAMDLLKITLFQLHQKVSKQGWQKITEQILLQHPVRDIVHQDPFTYRAYSKPRGYAGDAVMIDYIYGYFNTAELATQNSALVNKLSINSPSTRAVRNRLNFIVNKISALARQRDKPKILSVASGHCREFGLCSALHAINIGQFIAMDQDKESLDLVNREYANLGCTPMHGSVTTLLKNKEPSGGFDLVYALGLYDYLSQRMAQKLTLNLFHRLEPGGELVVANFRPDILDIGYMESYMAWELIYRDREEMIDLMKLIEPEEITDYRIFTEPERNIIFLSIRRR